METPIRTITTQKLIESVSVSNDIALVSCELNNANEGVFTYDLNSGQLRQTLKGQGNIDPFSAALSPDGRLAVVATDGPRAVLWDARTGALLRTVPSPGVGSDNNSKVAFSPDGQIIASVYLGDLVVFDTALAQKNHFKIVNPGGGVRAIPFSPEGRFLAVGFSRLDNGPDLIVYDLVSGQVKFTVATNNRIGVTGLAWTGNNLLAGKADGSIQLYDGQSGAPITRTFPKHARPVMAVAVSSDGRLALTGSEDSTMKVIEVATGKELHSFNHGGQIASVAFASNGKAAVSCGGTSLTLWDLSSL